MPGRGVDRTPNPKHAKYSDDGCPDLEIPSCLECPLEVCRYDAPGGVRALLNKHRDKQIRLARLKDPKVNADELAELYNVSRRTVFRVLHLREGD